MRRLWICKILFCTIFLLSFHPVGAQLHRKYIESGKSAFKSGDANSALRYYQKAMEIDSSHIRLNFLYAEALRVTNHYRQALHYYTKVSRSDQRREFTISLFQKAELLKILKNYDDAVKYHRKFLKRFKGNQEGYEYLKAKYEDEHYPELSHLLKRNAEIEIRNDYPINTGFSEFAGFFSGQDELIFSTLRSDSVKNKRILDSNTYYSRIYVSRNTQGWDTAWRHAAFMNDEPVHHANPVLSPKGEYIYYTECAGRNCKIIRARNDHGRWFDFEALPAKINLPESNNSQPILARIDGFDYLFFASDRPEGYGQMDIWYTVAYSNGLFDDPVNLGPGINSPGNELCPFYMESENSLYFSSDWHYGLGGFDIFKSAGIDGKFSRPENLGKPYNSSYNDLYFRYKDGNGVLTSNRENSKTDKFRNCCNDLYFFEFEPKSIKVEAEMTNLEKVERLLPLRLFFNNDEPNPRSNDTSTTILYSATYINYISKLDRYEKEYSRGKRREEKEDAQAEIRNFFENEIKLGYNDLKMVLGLIREELENGKSIELVIKGFASPLSGKEYNRKLTLRRISSVENEITEYKMGALRPYLESGNLEIIRQPFGEDRAAKGVSDDINDKRNAIYSKRAAFERRVEVIDVRLAKGPEG